MNGVIATFTPEWRSIFQTMYGNPPSNVNEAFRSRSTLKSFPCTMQAAQLQAEPTRSDDVLGLR